MTSKTVRPAQNNVKDVQHQHETVTGAKYPSDHPFAIFGGNYKGVIDTKELMKGLKAPSGKIDEEREAQLQNVRAPMTNRANVSKHAAPGVLKKPYGRTGYKT